MHPDPKKIILEYFKHVIEYTRAKYPDFRPSCLIQRAVLEDLIWRYCELWRHFHTLRHITDGLEKLSGATQHIKEPCIIWWAWMFHDVIYVPLASGNEYCSAEYSTMTLGRLDASPDLMEMVYWAICATKYHLVPEQYYGNKGDLEIMLDVDLSPLAASQERFDSDLHDLRSEACQLDDKEFAENTRTFFKELLARKTIFQSSAFAHLEQAARANMTRTFDM